MADIGAVPHGSPCFIVITVRCHWHHVHAYRGLEPKSRVFPRVSHDGQ